MQGRVVGGAVGITAIDTVVGRWIRRMSSVDTAVRDAFLPSTRRMRAQSLPGRVL